MPTIPSLERRTVTPQTRMATVDPRGAAALGRSIGQGVEDVRGAFKDAKDKSDRYELADAASKFSILKNQQDNAYDEGDLEYNTIPDRYALNVSDGLNEIAGGISNPELRNMFLLENQTKVAAGTERMKNVAFGVETQVQRANVNSRLNGLRDVILNSDVEEDRVAAINNVKDTLSAAMGKGYYTPEEFVNIEKAFTVDAAIGYVDTLPINEQRAALNSSMAVENIPEDIRAKKLRGLDDAEVLEQAQEIARSLVGKPLEEQLRESRKYSGKLYEEVKSQLDYENAKTKKVKLNTDQTLHQDWYMKVVTGDEGFTLDALQSKDNKDFLKLEVEFQKDLLRAARATVTSSQRTSSDAAVLDKLHSLNSNKKFEELRRYYKDNVGMLDSTDMDTWSKISNEGIIPPEYKPLFNMIQTVDQKLAAEGIKDVEDSLKVRNKLANWYKNEFDRIEGEPDPEKMEKQIDAYIKEVTIPDSGIIFDSDKRVFETNEEEFFKMGAKFLEDDGEMDDETFKFTSRELLNRYSDSPEDRFNALGTTLTRASEFDEVEQEELVEYIQKHEPKVFDAVYNAFAKRNMSVTSEEFIQGLSEVFNGTQ